MSPILLIIIGLIAVGLGLGIANWFARANPASIAKALRWSAIGLGLVVAVVLIAARPQFLPFALIFALPLFFWWRSRARSTRGSQRRGSGQGGAEHSAVETAYLRMALDHDSGLMRGEILCGRFAGRELGSLGLDDLLVLRSECETADPPSVRLVESYLDRMFGTDWRSHQSTTGRSENAAGSGHTPPESAAGRGMARAEAFELLGLAEGADREAVLSAWRRLIKLNHPDHGGSKYIAAKLNEAKRVLLGE
ncbi:MAG: molecular chaperone DnaJ [Alphaproteobacteria bacterium]|nr:molecular chaperone DnaJ [Alphaproteobacteria bacterium]